MATILTKKKDTTGAPLAGDLTNSSGGAELAVNTADKRLYTKDSGGNVVEIGTAPSTIDINAGTIDGTTIGANSASTGAFTTLTASGQTTVTGNSASTPAVSPVGDTNTGIFFPAADTIAFAEGGAEAMRIDSSGNVGIRKSSPSAPLDVQRSSVTYPALSTDTVAIFSKDSNALVEIITDPAAQSILYFSDSNQRGQGAFFYDHPTDSLRIQTAGTERARITSDGDFLVGTTSGTGSGRQELIVGGNAGGTYIGLGRGGTNKANIQVDSVDKLYIQNTASASINVTATTNGVVLANGATSWASASDERKKDIIEPITDGLNKVTSLRSVIGKYKTDDESARRIFLIAQDVQAVLPEAVQEDEEGDLLLAYTDIIPLLVSAVKDLKAITDTQAQTISALSTQLALCEARIATLEQE